MGFTATAASCVGGWSGVLMGDMVEREKEEREMVPERGRVRGCGGQGEGGEGFGL